MLRAMLILMAGLTLAACGDSSTAEPAVPAQLTSDVLVEGELDTVHSWLKTGENREVATVPASSVAALPPVEDMIHGLERRLENDADDRKGWSLLARSYAHVGRMSDARRAAANAVMLGEDAESLDRQIDAAHEGSL